MFTLKTTATTTKKHECKRFSTYVKSERMIDVNINVLIYVYLLRNVQLYHVCASVVRYVHSNRLIRGFNDTWGSICFVLSLVVS